MKRLVLFSTRIIPSNKQEQVVAQTRWKISVCINVLKYSSYRKNDTDKRVR